jgi:cation diffusion facilitator CzcD-associated flavoprotein CzcO
MPPGTTHQDPKDKDPNPQALPNGPVLVVGGGNSGFQIAEELAATRRVDLSVGERTPMLPSGWPAGTCSGGSPGWASWHARSATPAPV